MTDAEAYDLQCDNTDPEPEEHVDICPGCDEPVHASESDDDGYHPECKPKEAP